MRVGVIVLFVELWKGCFLFSCCEELLIFESSFKNK